MAVKRWKVGQGNKELSRRLAAELGIPPFAAHLLCMRGMTDTEQARAFIEPCNMPLCDPFTLPDMARAVERINKAIDFFEPMVVYGDYDVDGVSSTALLYSYLASRNANVRYMLPSRDEEGYGLSLTVIERLADSGVTLIITVDNGISAVNEIDLAKRLGIDTVVTDHHQPPEQLPEAYAIVDPHTDPDLPFRDWAGVGVAFKLVCALSGDTELMLKQYSDFVALGTVADIVPLVGENRALTAFGLKYMAEESHEGLATLMNLTGVKSKQVSAMDISYKLAPRLNSAGRMGKPDRAVELLLSADTRRCFSLASELNEENDRRHNEERRIGVEVWRQLDIRPSILDDRVIVLCGDGWNIGVIGIYAAKLCEQLGKPVILLSSDGTVARGSGRSLGEFSLHAALTSCSDLLIAFGGHKLAAGLTIETDKLGELRARINSYAASLSEMPVPEIPVDCELHPAYINTELAEAAGCLEPYGSRNPVPLIMIKGAVIDRIIPISGGAHYRFGISKDGYSLSIVKFGCLPGEMKYHVGDVIECVVTLGINTYNGRREVNLIVKDMRPSGLDIERIIEGQRIFERMRRCEIPDAALCEQLRPDREIFVKLYRFLERSGFTGSIELLAAELKKRDITVAKALIAMDAMRECGLIGIQRSGTAYVIKPGATAAKVNIEESTIMKQLTQGTTCSAEGEENMVS